MKLNHLIFSISVFIAALGFFGHVAVIGQLPSADTSPSEDASVEETMFSEAEGIIPLEERYRRKWDNALVADLDQDGHQDLILTEHGYRARLFWNNGGTFSKPDDIVHGDTHGVTAGDYDQDGRIDLIISRGGGDGSNPRNPVSFQVNRDRSIDGGEEFKDFERSRGRAAKLVDCDNDGSLDLVLSAFPLPSQKKGANHLFKNAGEGQFEFVNLLPSAKWMGFKVLVTDFDNDNVFDMIIYGGANMVAVRGREGLGYQAVTRTALGKLTDTSYVRSISEIDYDNDGDFDLFLAREDYPFNGESYFDAENGRYAFFTRREDFQPDDLTIEGDFIIENLQTAYPHFDVFVGAEKRLLKFDVERHGHKNVRLKPEEAEGWPDDHSEKGVHIGHLGNGVWRIAAETESPTAGVILNVTSTPQVPKEEEMPALLLENRDGVFVDVTEKLGISVSEQTSSSAVGDFDNDGWSDLFIVRHGNPARENEQILYMNQGGQRFVRSERHGVVSSELGATGGGAEVIDYDEDGDLDLIYCNERGSWHLFTNNGLTADQNNYVVVKVGGSPTKKASSLGAILTLKTGGQTYKRVVGATSSGFGLGANNHLHVGLGSVIKIDEATVRWTNGETEHLQIDAVNQSFVAGRMD